MYDDTSLWISTFTVWDCSFNSLTLIVVDMGWIFNHLKFMRELEGRTVCWIDGPTCFRDRGGGVRVCPVVWGRLQGGLGRRWQGQMSDGPVTFLGNSFQVRLEHVPLLGDELQLSLQESYTALLVVELFTPDGWQRGGGVDDTVSLPVPHVAASAGVAHPDHSLLWLHITNNQHHFDSEKKQTCSMWM